MEELTTLDRAIRLQKVELFSELDTELLALLASIAKQVRAPKGETLVEEDGSLAALYVVLAGRIAMRRGGADLFSIGPDETLGNWALFERQPSMATATAEEDSWLLRIDREDFYDLLADHGEVTRDLFQALFKRMRSLLSAGLAQSGQVRSRDGGSS